MFLWASLEEEPPKEATWEEYSTFEKDFSRFVTFSEFDHYEHVAVFSIEQNVPPYGAIDRDFVPTNFLSSFSINTHKGIAFFPIFISLLFFSY